MKNQPENFFTNPAALRLSPRASRPFAAFTLIEMLVVIAIIALLAGLITATGIGVVNKGKVKRTQTELAQLKTLIEHYKDKKGFYPPSNVTNMQTNALYYELVGTKSSGGASPTYTTLDGQDTVTPAMLTLMGITGLANSSTGASSDDAAGAESFAKSFGPKQVQKTASSATGIKLLISPVYGADLKDFNPWFYNSRNPTNNPDSYDLWTVINVGGKTNTICNWSERPIVK